MRNAQKEQEAYKLISEKVDAAYALIKEAEAIADENDVCFDFSLAYGMGGTYIPLPQRMEDDYDLDQGWMASSRSC